MNTKIFCSAFSAEKSWKKGVSAIAAQINKDLKGKSCDLLVFFVSESYANFDAKEFVNRLSLEIPSKIAIGCNSSGVIGDEEEIEMEPALSALAMHLPDVKVSSFAFNTEEIESIEKGSGLINRLDVFPPDKPKFLCLADPQTCDISKFLRAFNEGYKGLPVIGGLASGGVVGAQNWLSLNGEVFFEGAVGVALAGNIEFETIVSQGCRPVGKSFVITKAEGNLLYELAGKSALEVTKDVLEGLSAADKKISEHSLFVGLAINEQKSSFKRGDFLIRNIIGFDPDNETLAVGASLKVGQTLQFQLRDRHTSEEDLKIMVEKIDNSHQSDPHGAILVSCCGRGKQLFGKADHDIGIIQSMRGPLPLAGFFANGEIGPVDHKNYVHGYTSSLVILK